MWGEQVLLLIWLGCLNMARYLYAVGYSIRCVVALSNVHRLYYIVIIFYWQRILLFCPHYSELRTSFNSHLQMIILAQHKCIILEDTSSRCRTVVCHILIYVLNNSNSIMNITRPTVMRVLTKFIGGLNSRPLPNSPVQILIMPLFNFIKKRFFHAYHFADSSLMYDGDCFFPFVCLLISIIIFLMASMRMTKYALGNFPRISKYFIIT